MELQVNLVDSPVQEGPHTKILGVTLDRGLTFRPFVADVTSISKSLLNVMKALTFTTFGRL